MSRSKNPRCRWKGNNMQELEDFVEDHGGAVNFMGVGAGDGRVRMTAYLLPHGQVIRPGAWLERVPEFPAGEERGWKMTVEQIAVKRKRR